MSHEFFKPVGKEVQNNIFDYNDVALVNARKELFAILKDLITGQAPDPMLLDAEAIISTIDSKLITLVGKEKIQGLVESFLDYRVVFHKLEQSDIASQLEETGVSDCLNNEYGAVVGPMLYEQLLDSTLYDKGWYLEARLTIPEEYTRFVLSNGSITNPFINVKFSDVFGSEVPLIITIDARSNTSQENDAMIDHEEWHVLQGFWERSLMKRGVHYSTEGIDEVDPQDVTAAEMVQYHVADSIDTILYSELFAYLASEHIINTEEFLDFYLLGEYEYHMSEDQVLLQPILLQQTTGVWSEEVPLKKIEKNILRKIAEYKDKSSHSKTCQAELVWLESIQQHIAFWKKVEKIPELAAKYGMTARDIAFLFQFDSQAWQFNESPNPFDHLGGKLKLMFDSIK